MLLLKNRVSKIREIANSLYVNDPDFLKGFTVEAKLDQLINASEESYCYKVMTVNGLLVGFFCVPKNGDKNITGYFIAEILRDKPQLLSDFWKLVSQTVYGRLYESITPLNMAEEEFTALLVEDVTIPTPDHFFGINYNLNS